MLLEGKVALVTGAGRGVGRAIALALGREGARVLVNDLGCDREGAGRDPEVAAAVAQEIRDGGGQAIPSSDDVSAEGVPVRLVQEALDRFGRLDAVVAAAGILRDKTVLKLEP